MQKIGLEEELVQKVKEWMVQVVLPSYLKLVGIEEGASTSEDVRFSIGEKLILDIVKSVTANPEKVISVLQSCV
jgi:hypothetical protein